MRTADEHPSVSIRRRLHFERQQSIGEDVANFGQRNRSDCGHRSQIGQHSQHVLGFSKDPRREALEALQPVAPRRFVWPLGHRVDEREHERAQVLEILQLTLEMRDARRIRVVFPQLGDSQAIFFARPFKRRVQRSLPPITADSTSRASHFHGARNVPARMALSGCSGSWGRRVRGSRGVMIFVVIELRL